MKHTLLIFPFAVLFTLGTVRAFDVPPLIGTIGLPAPQLSPDSATGPVTNIDPVRLMLQVRDSSGLIKTFILDQNVEIVRAGVTVPLSALSLGDTVTVTRR